MYKLAELVEENKEELAAIEALDNGKYSRIRLIEDLRLSTGKTFKSALQFDLHFVVDTLRYYAGWADKIHGKTIEVCLCGPFI